MESQENMDVLLAGALLPGADPEVAAATLARMAGITPDQARVLVTCGKPRLVKRNLPPAAREALVRRFAEAGIKTVQRPAQSPQITSPPPEPEPSPEPAAAAEPAPPDELPREALGPAQAPARPEPRARADEEDFNPYAAPKADLRRPRSAGGVWRDVGAVVPAGHGLVWITEAWRLFRARPGAWCGAILLNFACGMLVGLIPFVGQLAAQFLAPVFGGGISLMAHRQSEGEDIGASGVFDGFRFCFGPLALIGLFIFIFSAVVGLLAALVIGLPLISAAMSGGAPDPALFGRISGRLLPVMLLGLLVLIPMMLALLFAPTLVAVAGQSPGNAMRAGIGAGFRNWMAFLVNGLAVVFVCGGLGIVVGVAIGVLKALGLLILAVPLVLVMLAPILGIFTVMGYTATRDIFYDEGED